MLTPWQSGVAEAAQKLNYKGLRGFGVLIQALSSCLISALILSTCVFGMAALQYGGTLALSSSIAWPLVAQSILQRIAGGV